MIKDISKQDEEDREWLEYVIRVKIIEEVLSSHNHKIKEVELKKPTFPNSNPYEKG